MAVADESADVMDDLEPESLCSCECLLCGRVTNEGVGCRYDEALEDWVCDCGGRVFEHEER